MREYQYSINKLPNGLRVLHVPSLDAPDVFVTMTGRAGRRAELPHENGVAHFLEHLLFAGTRKRPASLALNSFLEDRGGSPNDYTHVEKVEYEVRILRENAEAAFDYLSDILMNSLLAENDIEKQRQVIAQETAARRDNPHARLERLSLSVLYPGQAIGRSILDDEANLEAMTKELLISYMERTYSATNFVLTVAGGIELGAAMELAETYFGRLKRGRSIQVDPAQCNKRRERHIAYANLRQAPVAVSYEGFPLTASAEACAAGLLNRILGSSRSSRLSMRIREELHLAYSIGSVAVSMSDTGYLMIRAAVGENDASRAIDEILSVIDTLLRDGISDEELQRARNIGLAALFISMESMSSRARFLTNQLLWKGGIEDVEDRATRVRQTTVEDVMRVARQMFSDAPAIVALTKNLDQLRAA